MNASRVIGPVIGSVAYHLVGPAWVFAGNAATYLFVIASLGMVTLPALPVVTQHASRWRELTAGLTTARTDPIVGKCLVTVFVFSLLALAFLGQMPVVAAHSLGINPKSANYGILYASFGTGALFGAISIGTVFARTSKPMIVRVCLVGYAVTLTGFALLRAAWPAYFVVALLGAFYFAFITALNTALQARLEDAVRGRVMALWIMGFGGTWRSATSSLDPSSARWGSPRCWSSAPASRCCWPGTPTYANPSLRWARSGWNWPSRRRATSSCRASRSRHAASRR
jgi:hypothetical protein